MDHANRLGELQGQTALVEGGALNATGTVASVDGEVVTITCDQACWPSGEVREVSVSVFAPDALYRISGEATANNNDLICGTDAAIERIQRRQWPRKRLDLPVTLCAVENGAHVGGVPGHTIDLSIGGAHIETLRRVEGEGDPMVILDLPDGSTIVTGSSTVAINEVGEGWRYRLAFRNLDSDDADRLAELTSA